MLTRTFIALEMNNVQQGQLAELIRQLALLMPGVRWVDPAGIHLTLAFLGELDDEQLADAIQVAELAASQCSAFSYRLSRLGIFGAPEQPRVIWMGINEPSGSLQRLQRTLSRELARRGFELDKRGFSPHLTLARVKAPLTSDEQQNFQRLIAGLLAGLVSAQSYQVNALYVMKSELFRTGASYTCLRVCALQ